MLIIYRSLFILPLLMATTFAKGHLIPSRKPQVLFQGKHGHRRNVGKIQALLPLISKMDSLWFLDLRFLKDSHTNKEGNFGLGYRYKGHEAIFGFYGFFDRRRSLLDNMYNQFTIGCERLTEKSDVRLNLYFPQEKIFKTHLQYHDSIMTTIETPLKGMDFEVGSSVPFLESLKVYAGGFAFKGKEKVPSFAGYSARMQWKWNDYVSMETSYRKDCVRKNHAYVGVSIQIAIGQSSHQKISEKNLSNFEKRMVDFPIRDEDIVAVVSRHVKVHPFIQSWVSYEEEDYHDPAMVQKEENKKKALIFLEECQSESTQIQPVQTFEKEEEEVQREKDLLDDGSFIFDEKVFEKGAKDGHLLDIEPLVELKESLHQEERAQDDVVDSTVQDETIVSLETATIEEDVLVQDSATVMDHDERQTQTTQEQHAAVYNPPIIKGSTVLKQDEAIPPAEEIFNVFQNSIENQGYDPQSLYEYFQNLLLQEEEDEDDSEEQRKWILEKQQIEKEIEISRQDEFNQSRLKSQRPQVNSLKMRKSSHLDIHFKSRSKEDPLQKKVKPPIDIQLEREKLERETEQFLRKSEEKRIRLEQEFTQAFEKVFDDEKENHKPKDTLKQREEYALIFAQKEKTELMKGLNTLKQGQILFDEKVALKTKIEEAFTILEQELSALQRPSIRRYEFLHHYQDWKEQIHRKASMPCLVLEQKNEKRESFDKNLFENIVYSMFLKGETKVSVIHHLKNIPLQAEDDENRKWRIEHENLLEEIQKSKEIEEKESLQRSKQNQKRPNKINMSQFGNLMLRGKKEEEGVKVEKSIKRENIDHQERLQKIREEALLAEQNNLRENEEKERQARLKREKAENQFKDTFVKFQGYIHPQHYSYTAMTLNQMEEKMRNDVQKVTYDLMCRLNQLSYGQILFDQRSQLRDDLQKLSDSLYQEIHPIFLKRPTHKRFDFVNQYENFVCEISDAEGRERKELRVE